MKSIYLMNVKELEWELQRHEAAIREIKRLIRISPKQYGLPSLKCVQPTKERDEVIP